MNVKNKLLNSTMSFIMIFIMISPVFASSLGRSNESSTEINTIQNNNFESSTDRFGNVNFNVEIAVLVGDESQEVTIAYDYVRENIPSYLYTVIDNFDLARDYDILIVIAHGNENGLQLRLNKVSWETVGNKISNTKISQIFTIACDGAYLSDYISNDIKTFSFIGSIDAKIGGLLATLVISLFQNLESGYLISALFERGEEIENGDPVIELARFYRSDAEAIYLKLGWLKIQIDTSGYIEWWFSGTDASNWTFELSAWGVLVGIGASVIGAIISVFGWWVGTSSTCNTNNEVAFGIKSKMSRLHTDIYLLCTEAYTLPYPTSLEMVIPGAIWVEAMDYLFDTNGNWYWMEI